MQALQTRTVWSMEQYVMTALRWDLSELRSRPDIRRKRDLKRWPIELRDEIGICGVQG